MNSLKSKNTLQITFLIMSFILFIYFYIIGYTNTFSVARAHVLWKERLIFPFYFTTITSLLICVLLSFKVFAKTTFLQKQNFSLFEIIVIVNSSITMIVYWALLARRSFPALIEKQAYLNIVANIAVHLLIPLFAIGNFFYELVFLKNKTQIKENIYVFSLKAMLFPILWLVIASIFYFSLGAQKEDAFYDFLNLIGNPFWITSLYFIVINSLYYALALLFTFLNNHFFKKN